VQKSERGLVSAELLAQASNLPSKHRNSQHFRLVWAYPLKALPQIKKLHIGLVLNIPCGISQFGDVRADIDSCVKPDIICDLHFLPFRKQAFDTVHSDPPYAMLNTQSWLYKLFDLADRVIIDGPVNIQIGRRWIKDYYVLESNTQFLRFLQVFNLRKDKKQKHMSAFLRPRPKG